MEDDIRINIDEFIRRLDALEEWKRELEALEANKIVEEAEVEVELNPLQEMIINGYNPFRRKENK